MNVNRGGGIPTPISQQTTIADSHIKEKTKTISKEKMSKPPNVNIENPSMKDYKKIMNEQNLKSSKESKEIEAKKSKDLNSTNNTICLCNKINDETLFENNHCKLCGRSRHHQQNSPPKRIEKGGESENNKDIKETINIKEMKDSKAADQKFEPKPLLNNYMSRQPNNNIQNQHSNMSSNAHQNLSTNSTNSVIKKGDSKHTL